MTSFLIEEHVDRKVSGNWQDGSDCTFCRIIRGDVPAHRVLENDKIISILDILPLRPGHILVIPKIHCPRISDLPVDYAGAVGEAISRVGKALTEVLDNTGLNVVGNQEYAQAVLHAHYHVIPAPRLNEISQTAKPFSVPLSRAEMHRREFKSREELDDGFANDLVVKLSTSMSSEIWTPQDMSEDETGSEDMGDTNYGRAPTTQRGGESKSAMILLRTAFDSYFTHFAKSTTKTGPTAFSAKVEPLSAEEYHAATSSLSSLASQAASISLQQSLTSHFPRFCLELDEGFNLIFYGFGSKRRIVNRFAAEVCSERGHVVVVNGSQPKSSIKNLLSTIETIPDLQLMPVSSPDSNVESQIRRICDFFHPTNGQPSLYIFIHNIDSHPFRSSQAKSCLSALASSPRIHLVATVDHINFPLLWTSSAISTRLRNAGDDDESSTSFHLHGFSWLWHDMTTFASYDFELGHADRSSFAGASMQHGYRRTGELQSAVIASSGRGAISMTETAAQHILASVTQKAKRLFALMARKQLEMIEEDDDAVTEDLQRFALAYDTLFTSVRDNFIATNDTALQSLLGEFRDHNLVVSSGSGTTEVLWIPLRKERLARVLTTLQVD